MSGYGNPEFWKPHWDEWSSDWEEDWLADELEEWAEIATDSRMADCLRQSAEVLRSAADRIDQEFGVGERNKPEPPRPVRP